MFYKKHKDYAVDKRQFFRIDDSVYLKIKKIENVTGIDELESLYLSRLPIDSIGHDISYESERYLPLAKAIQNKHPDIYEYLNYLENKINILSLKIANSEDAPSNDKQYQVNISASGMRFISDKIYKLNDYLDFCITLLPSKKNIYLFANVVRVTMQTRNQASIAVEFSIINEANKEALIKHIHQKQLNTLHNNG